MMTLQDARLQKILAVTHALLETIKEAGPEGAPSSALYMACQQYRVSLEQYVAIMDLLQSKGFVTQSNHCYYITEAGKCK
jgi:hypothetical protein